MKTATLLMQQSKHLKMMNCVKKYFAFGASKFKIQIETARKQLKWCCVSKCNICTISINDSHFSVVRCVCVCVVWYIWTKDNEDPLHSHSHTTIINSDQIKWAIKLYKGKQQVTKQKQIMSGMEHYHAVVFVAVRIMRLYLRFFTRFLFIWLRSLFCRQSHSIVFYCILN